MSETPNLDKVLKYARDNKMKSLEAALKRLYSFVGANDLKENFAMSIQYYIVTNTPAKVRRSKRRRVQRRRIQRRRVPTKPEELSNDEMSASEEDIDIKDTIFRLIMAEKLKDMIGEDSDSSDEDYVPEAESPPKQTRKRKVREEPKLKKLHTCLLGQPGVGKTLFANIMVDVWSALGVVDKNKYFVTGRADWVAKYHGHSSQKAKKLIKKAKGGCIFIDEAYALVGAGDDLFGSEVLTSIVESMTSASKDVIFIMAGYKDKMDRLFKNNAGLERRFSYIFEFPKPSVRQTVEIFKTQVKKTKWKLSKCTEDDITAFFQHNSREFTHGGGSTERFLDYCQHAAVTRSFPNKPSKTMTMQDMHTALKAMKNVNKKISSAGEPPATMYI